MQDTKKKNSLYIDTRPKIKAFVEEVGHIYLFQYLLEELENNEINETGDMWIIRAIEGLEYAYNAYLSKSNVDEYNVEIEYNHET